MTRAPSPPRIIALSVALLSLLGASLLLPGIASGQATPRRIPDLVATHGPVAVALADPTSDGHRLGDVRVTSAPIADASGQTIGRLDATLITTALDVPAAGDEVRLATLVFSFGDGTDQLVVSGASVYPARGSTIAVGAVTTRPVVGGSGSWAGATGEATSEHLADDTWQHIFWLGRGIAPNERAATCPMGGMDGMDDPMHRPMDGMDGMDDPMHRPMDGMDGMDGAQHGRMDGTMRDRMRALHEHLHALHQRMRRVAGVHCAMADSGDGAGRHHRGGLGGHGMMGGDRRPTTSAEPIVRTPLGQTQPRTAPGQALGLWHYVIAPGASLVPHTHPGWQVARIIRGTLEYTVIDGQATVLRADGSTETAEGGAVLELRPGDSVVENPDLAHFGANRGRTPVVILAASLFAEGEAPAVPLPSTQPAASPAPAASLGA